MKILIMKTIFCPNKEYVIHSLVSLQTMIDYLNDKERDYEIELFITGWCEDEWKPYFDKVLVNSGLTFRTEYYDHNYGKYHYFRLLECNADYLIYFDHDIILKYTYDIFEPIKLIGHDNIEYVAYNHLDDSRHQQNVNENIDELDGIRYGYPNSGDYGSIADGAFVCSNKVYNLFQYLPKLSVYGLDDFHINQLVGEKGLKSIVCIDIFVSHPYDTDIEYKRWKLWVIGTLVQNKSSAQEFYNDTLISSVKFWLN